MSTSREELRDALSGPIVSIRTPFTRDGQIDFESLLRYVDFAIGAGSRTVFFTPGDSLYALLDDDEVAALTRTVGAHVRGRALFMAADRQWWTGRTVEFARFARDAGAAAMLVSPPAWGDSATGDALADHYRTVSEAIPVIVLTGALGRLGVSRALDLVAALLEDADNVVGAKEDFCSEFARKMCLLAHGKWAIFAGGQKQTHLDMLPYGCDGYLSTFLTFQPRIAWEYWRAIETGDLGRAGAVIRDYDMPFFDFIMGLPGGFDAGLHGCYELYGIARRWRRPPFLSLSDADMARLADFLDAKGLR